MYNMVMLNICFISKKKKNYMLIIGMLLRNLSIVKIGPYTKVLLLLQGNQM